MASPSWLEAVKERARRALDKPAAYGPDVDISVFRDGGPADEASVASVAEAVGV